jgi:tRNA (adenine37-N6)-methyltransferase
MEFTVRPVAFVHSSRTKPVDDDWDKERCVIELADHVPDDALIGLDAYSHVDVLFVFDRANDAPPAPFARHPRGDERWPRVGIFAQRAKDRPNRIGLTTCRIVAVSSRRVEVAGLDAIEGTPVLDLKAHLAQFGARGEVRQPAWVDELMSAYFEGHTET